MRRALAGERTVSSDAGLDKTNGAYSPGIYMARDWRAISKTEFPMLVGGHNLFTWGQLEPTEGNFDWHVIDDMIATNAATGKKSAFGITTYNGRIEGGIQMPSWIANNAQAVVTCTG